MHGNLRHEDKRKCVQAIEKQKHMEDLINARVKQ